MKAFRLVLAALLVAATTAPALAAKKKVVRAKCVDQPQEFSWRFLVDANRGPAPNGCAPPVYQYNQYIGQDPDPNIRFQLQRDPRTGYSGGMSN
jgi:hypothetical protein